MSDQNNTPTQSEKPTVQTWQPQPPSSPKSVFANYRAEFHNTTNQITATDAAPLHCNSAAISDDTDSAALAMVRSFIWRFLAEAFADPTDDGLEWLRSKATLDTLLSASRMLDETANTNLTAQASTVAYSLALETIDSRKMAAATLFGHSERGPCPRNETEYGRPNASPMFQPHILADLAAFYRVFGLELTGNACERHDHFSIELEFMAVLSAKEAHALASSLDEQAQVCRSTAIKFFRDHLSQWAPAMLQRIIKMDAGTWKYLAQLAAAFLAAEAARMKVPLGSDALPLIPIEPDINFSCASCGTGGSLFNEPHLSSSP